MCAHIMPWHLQGLEVSRWKEVMPSLPLLPAFQYLPPGGPTPVCEPACK